MSLDVYLTGETTEAECTCPDCGHQHTRTVTERFYDANITHNLNQMADAAGIYMHLWRPEEIGITKARQLIEPLREGLERMRNDPDHYEQFNAKNGWGLYEHFVPWIASYLSACEEHPDADVSVSR